MDAGRWAVLGSVCTRCRSTAGSSEAAAAPGMRGTTAAVASWALVETGMKREAAACLCAVVASDAAAMEGFAATVPAA